MHLLALSSVDKCSCNHRVSAAPAKGQRRVWVFFLAVKPSCILPLGPQKSPGGLPKSRKVDSQPSVKTTSISDLVSDLILERFWRSFGGNFKSFSVPKALSETDKFKNEKPLILLVYTQHREGRPSHNVTKIHENPLSELTFFETRNRLGI